MTNDLNTLSGALLEMKDQLIYELGQKGVTASYSSSTGLLGLIAEISNIQTGSSCYHIAFDQSSYTATGGSVTISCTLQQNYQVLSGATVTFTATGISQTATTDSNGVATTTINNLSSDVTITATYQNVTDTCTVTTQNIIFDDSTEYTATVTPSGDTRRNIIPTFNFDASVDFEMTCDVYFSKEDSAFGLFPSNNTTQYKYHLAYGQNVDRESVYYGNSNGGESAVRKYGTQSFNEWFSLKFVKVGYKVTTYKNGTLFSSNIPTTTLGDHGNMMFAFGFWGSGSHTGKVKNLKIVQI